MSPKNLGFQNENEFNYEQNERRRIDYRRRSSTNSAAKSARSSFKAPNGIHRRNKRHYGV